MVFLAALPLSKAHVSLLPSGKAICLSKPMGLSYNVPFFEALSPSKGSKIIVESLLPNIVLHF